MIILTLPGKAGLKQLDSGNVTKLRKLLHKGIDNRYMSIYVAQTCVNLHRPVMVSLWPKFGIAEGYKFTVNSQNVTQDLEKILNPNKTEKTEDWPEFLSANEKNPDK